MKAIVQRVDSGRVEVDGDVVGAVQRGLLVLAAVCEGDTEKDRRWMADKLANLRIFPDDEDRMNLSLLDIGGSMLLISNFTVAGSCRKGRRPSFDGAMKPPEAEQEFDKLVEEVRGMGVEVQTGAFGAHMMVSILNNGPVTLIVDSRE